jgi:hypothetical protein
MRTRIAFGLALALAGVIVTGVRSAEPDVETLLSEAQRVQEADHQAWHDYSFRRHVIRQDVDREGTPKLLQEMHFLVMPKGDGFDEALLEIDGRQPTDKEIEKHRKAGRFENHWRESATLELDNPVGEDLALGEMLREQDHRIVGEEEIDGIRCHRTEFSPRPEPEKATTNERLSHAMKGTACFSVDGLHLVEAEMVTTRPVKKGPAALNKLRIKMEQRPVGDVWLPTLVEMESDVKLPGKKLRKWNKYLYTKYRRTADER